jgi:hypothetical protein
VNCFNGALITSKQHEAVCCMTFLNSEAFDRDPYTSVFLPEYNSRSLIYLNIFMAERGKCYLRSHWLLAFSKVNSNSELLFTTQDGEFLI